MKANKKLLTAVLTALVAGTMVAGSNVSAFDTETIKQKYEAFKEKMKERYEQAKTSVSAHLNENEKIQAIRQSLAERIQKFRDGLSSSPQTLKQKYYELRGDLEKTQDPEEKREILIKMQLIKQKYHEVIEKLKEEAKEKAEMAKKKAEEMKEKMEERYEQYKNKYEQSRRQVANNITNMAKISLDSIKLPEQLTKRIDSILQTKLFDRLSKLPEDKQRQIYEKISNRLTAGIQTVEKQFNYVANESTKKKLAYKYNILKYVKEKIDTKLKSLEEENPNALIDNILGQYLTE